jgi:hypothetical protein
MAEGEVCITPNDCSSLFKQLGYTTYYHTIQTTLTRGFGLEIGIAEFSMIIAFATISILTIFRFFQKHFKDDELSFIASLATLLFFELGAYSLNFVIPQTFVFLLFVNLITETNLTWFKIIISTPILLATHFIFGPFFTVILFIYKIFFSSTKESRNKLAKTISFLSFLTILVTFVANWRGFSIEKLIQQTDVAQLGFYSNYYFPENLEFLLKQYGAILLPLLISIIYFLSKKKINSKILFAITYISIGVSCYFVGPTYANKFLIGIAVFGIFLITNLLINLNMKKFMKFLLMLIILLSAIPIYLINYSQYTNFYLQDNGKISALTNEDKQIVKYLENTDFQCQFLSDPYTQLMITGQTTYDSAGGQYQELQTRSDFIDFIQNPTEETYENLLTSSDLQDPFCILISSRLQAYKKYASDSNIPWLNILYEYEINNDYGVGDTSLLQEFLTTKRYEITYQDSNFIIFIPITE